MEVLELVIKVSENIAEVSGKIKGQLEEIQKAAESAGNSIEDMASRMKTAGNIMLGVGAGLLGTFIALSRAGMNYATMLDKQSKQLGLTAEQTAVMLGTLEELDVEANAVIPAIYYLHGQLAHGAEKTGDAAEKASSKIKKGLSEQEKAYNKLMQPVRELAEKKQRLLNNLSELNLKFAEHAMRVEEVGRQYKAALNEIALAQQKLNWESQSKMLMLQYNLFSRLRDIQLEAALINLEYAANMKKLNAEFYYGQINAQQYAARLMELQIERQMALARLQVAQERAYREHVGKAMELQFTLYEKQIEIQMQAAQAAEQYRRQQAELARLYMQLQAQQQSYISELASVNNQLRASMMQVGVAMTYVANSVDNAANRITMAFEKVSASSERVNQVVEAIKAKAREAATPTEAFFTTVSELRKIQDETLRMQAMRQLFGRYAPQIAPLVQMSEEEYQRTQQQYQAIAPSPETVARVDSLSDSINRLLLAIKSLGAELLAAIAPQLQQFIEHLTELIIKIKEFIKEHPNLAKLFATFMLGGGAISSFLGAALHFAANIALIAGNWGALTGALRGGFGILSFGRFIFMGFGAAIKFVVGAVTALAAALGLPVWAVVALIAAIVAVIAVIVKFRKEIWEFIKKAATWIWEGLKKIGGAIWDFLKGLWEKLKGWFKYLWELSKEGRKLIFDYIKGLVSKIAELPSALWEKIKEIASKAYEWGKKLVEQFWEGIKSLARKPVEAFQWIVQKIRNLLPFSPPKEGALRDLPVAARKLGEILADNFVIPIDKINAQLGNLVAGVSPAVATPRIAPAGASGHYVYTISFASDKEINSQLRSKIAEFIENEFVPFLRRVM